MAKNRGKILVVDDNNGIRSALKILLPKYFEKVELIASPNMLNAMLREFRPDVILLDMNFHTDMNTGNEGLYWLGEIKKTNADVQVVLFTAYADISLAVEGMKRGAFDFIVKPWENEKLVFTLKSACDKVLNISDKSKKVAERPTVINKMFWGESKEMISIRGIVDKIAPTSASILITGENGTGKDMLAGEIHRLSDRCGEQMVCVDAGAITETLFESELFGHVKGAFTDAYTEHVGKIEQANGGTLFLDEVGNIPLHLQAKLLRALQNRAVVRVGDTRPIPVNIRLICATNRNIEEMVRDGEFREDLYYRINTIHIQLPPLRARKNDIIPLSEIFISRYADKYHRKLTGMTVAARKKLVECKWKGNIRELQNCIEKAVILAEKNVLDDCDFSLPANVAIAEPVNGEETLEMVEERTIRAALERFGGNLTHVAKSLNISRPTLYSKLKKYNI